MHPVVRRILLNGGLTAVILAIIGVAFGQLAGMWTAGAVRPGSTDLNPSTDNALRYRVPLMMAFWGFVFVAGWELVLYRLRGNKLPEAKPAEKQPDEAEKLLNELLAQSEAKMAADQPGQAASGEGQEQK